MSYFTTGLRKEHETNQPPPTRRLRERPKEMPRVLPPSQNPSCWLLSWLDQCMRPPGRTSSQERLAKEIPSPSKPRLRAMLQNSSDSLTLLLSAREPLAVKPLALSARTSLWTIPFLSIRQKPTLGPWKGLPPAMKGDSGGLSFAVTESPPSSVLEGPT